MDVIHEPTGEEYVDATRKSVWRKVEDIKVGDKVYFLDVYMEVAATAEGEIKLKEDGWPSCTLSFGPGSRLMVLL